MIEGREEGDVGRHSPATGEVKEAVEDLNGSVVQGGMAISINDDSE